MTTLREFGWKQWKCRISGDVYVETGLDLGNSMAHAVAARSINHLPMFQRLAGIEIDPRRADHCRERFKTDKRVQIHEGSSVDILPKVLDPSLRHVFWLDAHALGDDPATWSKRDGQCPLLQELKIIVGQPWNVRPVILIDDANMFCSAHEWRERFLPKGFRPKDFPTFGDIFDALGGVDGRYEIVIGRGSEPGGVLYCF